MADLNYKFIGVNIGQLANEVRLLQPVKWPLISAYLAQTMRTI